MNKLIEIAKANGAKPHREYDVSVGAYREYGDVVIGESQLRATVEQVCAPLVDKLDKLEKWAHLWTDETNGLLVECRKEIANYRTLIGDKK